MRPGLRRRWIVALAASVLAVSGFVFAQSSFAVHDTGMFELDGNTAHDSATTPPWDWNDLFDASGNQLITPDPVNGPLLASTFVADYAKPDNSYFASNKDIQPIANWGCSPLSNPLKKDDLQNAYAALVQIPAGAPDNAGDTVLYLGSERASNNGTSFAGFWLFKDSGVGCQGTNSFSGHHTDGDLLIVSDYTGGGGSNDVSVYRWTGNDATGHLVLQSSGGVCGSSSPDDACAISNSTAAITTPWAPGNRPTNTFVEAGIDLTTLLGASGGCFTTFMAETRSSAQLTATLKDFSGGQFNTCAKPPVDTTATPGGSLVAPGTAQHDVATVSAVGSKPTPTGKITFTLCGPSDVTAAGCPSGSGTQVGLPAFVVNGSATSDDVSGATDTAVGKYCWGAQYTPDAASQGNYLPSYDTNATTECFTVAHASPTIATTIAVNGTEPGTLGLTSLGDSATLSGSIGNTDGETVTFNLYGPFAAADTPSCTAPNLVFTTTGNLSGGTATTTSSYTPTSGGVYVWQATYPGDALNDPATDACNESSEKTTIIGPVITVTKSANPPGPVSAGDEIGFDISITNTPAASATNVVITDDLPAGADLDWALDPAFAGCSIAGPVGTQVLTCSLGTVGKGATVGPIHVQSSTQSADCGVVDNTAMFTSDNGGTGSDSASVTILCANVSLAKAADAASVSAGQQIGFTVTASNAGPGIARNVAINDPLPSGTGVDWSIASGPANCSITGSAPTQTLVCTAVDLTSGSSEVVHVVSGTAFASCGTYDNTATLTTTNTTAPNPASASTRVLCPDLTLTKTADDAVVDAGDQIGFTIGVSNSGLGTASDVVINDPLPGGSGVDWSIASGPANCSITGTAPTQTLACTAVDLVSGGSETVHVISATAFASCATYHNTASLTASNHPPLTADASTTVDCPAVTLTKKADASPVDAGDQIGFTITASNSSAPGTGTANGVVIDDPLPGGSGVDWSIDSGPANCSVTGSAPTQTLHCTTVDLAPGDTETIHIISATEFASCATYSNTATLTATNHPTLTANDSVSVQCPSLVMTKTADAGVVSAGSTIGFTVTITNFGPGGAHDAMINDPLPGGPGVSWSISPAYVGPGTCAITGTAPAQTLSCAVGDLASSASASVHITSGTAFASCGTYDNTASGSAANDPTPVTGNASTVVQCPDLSLAKTADTATVTNGKPVGFTITASNAGPGTATSVTINDPLPGFDGINWSIDPAYAGPGTCTISGSSPQVLNCQFGDVAAGDSASVHITSPTSNTGCGDLDNTATLTATNAPGLTASATTHVNCGQILAETGAGPIGAEVRWGLVLVVVGGLLAFAGAFRRGTRFGR